MANKNPSPSTRFGAGQVGNPGGKPIGARNKLSAAFLEAVTSDFEAHGSKALEQLRIDKPDKYCELIAGLLPTEANVSVKSDSTITHVNEPVSDTARWIGETLRGRAEGEAKEPLPN